MKKTVQANLHHRFIFYVAVGVTIFLFLFLTMYFIAFKDTGKSYSLVQTWKEYYGVEDWNLTKHAIADIDGDGKKDMVTFTNCAFLSSVTKNQIAPENRCMEPGISRIVFQDENERVGQKLTPSKPFFYQWLRKSYLVKTKSDIWKFYDMNGFQLRVYELDTNKLFHETQPTILDWIDTYTYEFSHMGIIVFLMTFHI
jgi:hypothetical protein